MGFLILGEQKGKVPLNKNLPLGQTLDYIKHESTLLTNIYF